MNDHEALEVDHEESRAPEEVDDGVSLHDPSDRDRDRDQDGEVGPQSRDTETER